MCDESREVLLGQQLEGGIGLPLQAVIHCPWYGGGFSREVVCVQGFESLTDGVGVLEGRQCLDGVQIVDKKGKGLWSMCAHKIGEALVEREFAKDYLQVLRGE